MARRVIRIEYRLNDGEPETVKCLIKESETVRLDEKLEMYNKGRPVEKMAESVINVIDPENHYLSLKNSLMSKEEMKKRNRRASIISFLLLLVPAFLLNIGTLLPLRLGSVLSLLVFNTFFAIPFFLTAVIISRRHKERYAL